MINWDKPVSREEWDYTPWHATAEYHDIDTETLINACDEAAPYDAYLTYCKLRNSPLYRALE